VILLGFNNGRSGRMALFAHVRRFAALSRCGELPGGPCLGGPPPWAVALRRAAAAWCGESPVGASRPLPAVDASSAAAMGVRGHAPPRRTVRSARP
jgi:hypothetical protein